MNATTMGVDTPEKNGRLTGSLHVWDIMFMVIATSAPLTVIVAVYPIGFTIGNGAGFPAAFLGMGIVLLIFSVGFTTMTRHVPKPGAFFTYIAHGLGRPLGLAGAYVAILCYECIELGVVAYFGYDVSVTIAGYTGIHVPWFLLSTLEWLAIGFLGYRNIEISAKVLGVLLSVEILISLVISFVVLADGGAHGIDAVSFAPSAFLSGAPSLGIMFAAASYIGFESTAIYRDEARDPPRTIPHATYGAVVVLAVFYTFTSWAFVMALGSADVVKAANADPQFLFTVAERYIGGTGNILTHIFVITSIFAVTLAFHNVVARYLHALGNVRALPTYLGRVGSRAAPSAASLTTSAMTAIIIVAATFAGWDPAAQMFTWFVGLGTLAYLIILAACSLAVFVYFALKAERRRAESTWKVIVLPVLAVLGLGIACYITIANFPLLVGDVDAKGNVIFGGLSAALLVVLIAFAVFGFVEAYVMRVRNRPAYDAITESGKGL
ncbi:MAG: APC family permease [Nevskiaceae bacterium]|nr:MAG: APC family permease [Nevskiaceae bacterium]TBR73728.1 MAG: APC family permease [Nevskiaceae bacterium]